MSSHIQTVDVEKLPVHLFVKSAKQAKKLDKKIEPLPAFDASSYRRALAAKYAIAG
jgi:hypothetical protein